LSITYISCLSSLVTLDGKAKHEIKIRSMSHFPAINLIEMNRRKAIKHHR